VWGGGGVSVNNYSCTNGAQINFGDLTPYLTPLITTNKEAIGKERDFENKFNKKNKTFERIM
jgi:hypothetical protein